MSIGTKGNFKIYNEFLQTGMVETATQFSAAFNAASRGTIVLSSVARKGDFVYESFWANTAGLISRRDPTSTADVTDTPLNQAEFAFVKVNRKIGPVAQTIDSFKKIGVAADENSLNYAVGVQSAKAMQIEQLNTGIRAIRAALLGQAATNVFDNTGNADGKMNTESLVDGIAMYGDASDAIVCWVMHSKPYFDLVKNQMSENIMGVSNFNIATGTPVTLNRPVIVTDSPSLIQAGVGSGAFNTYYTLGLTAGAVELEDSEETTMVTQFVTGKENLIIRLQGEYAYNVGIKGMRYDVANGGENPSDTALGTGSNWDPALVDPKNWGGVIIATK